MLASVLIKHAKLSLQTACRYMRNIEDTLDYIHRQGIIHRDIKASNVLLDDEGRCYLYQLGIARAMTNSSQELTGTGNVLGTVDYMAPELLEVTSTCRTQQRSLHGRVFCSSRW